SVSLITEALKAMNGRPAHADELWIAWASNVLPVPVSPRSTTGTSDLAASAASCRQRAMAGLLVVRSSSLSLEGASFMRARTVFRFPAADWKGNSTNRGRPLAHHVCQSRRCSLSPGPQCDGLHGSCSSDVQSQSLCGQPLAAQGSPESRV